MPEPPFFQYGPRRRETDGCGERPQACHEADQGPHIGLVDQTGQYCAARVRRGADGADAVPAAFAVRRNADHPPRPRGQGGAADRGGTVAVPLPAAVRHPGERLQPHTVLRAPPEHAARVRIRVADRHRVRRHGGLPGDAHQFEVRQIRVRRVHVSLHHALVDAGAVLGELLQERQHRPEDLQRHHGRGVRRVHAGVVRVRRVSDRAGAGPALRPLRLYTDRHHAAQHGRQLGGGGHHIADPARAHHPPHHAAGGAARPDVHVPAGVRQLHERLLGAGVPGLAGALLRAVHEDEVADGQLPRPGLHHRGGHDPDGHDHTLFEPAGDHCCSTSG